MSVNLNANHQLSDVMAQKHPAYNKGYFKTNWTVANRHRATMQRKNSEPQ